MTNLNEMKKLAGLTLNEGVMDWLKKKKLSIGNKLFWDATPKELAREVRHMSNDELYRVYDIYDGTELSQKSMDNDIAPIMYNLVKKEINRRTNGGDPNTGGQMPFDFRKNESTGAPQRETDVPVEDWEEDLIDPSTGEYRDNMDESKKLYNDILKRACDDKDKKTAKAALGCGADRDILTDEQCEFLAELDEDFDLQNGYNNAHQIDGNDYGFDNTESTTDMPNANPKVVRFTKDDLQESIHNNLKNAYTKFKG